MRRVKVLLMVLVLVFAQFLPSWPMDKLTSRMYALDDGLALTPPMGWNSWNKFHCNINEELILQTADAMVESGMKDAGYIYVNIDDCWMAPARDANGDLQADPVRFPHGIKYIADYVHSKGLKLGIYSSNGTKTCQGLPASLGNEERDAAKFAEWGVDYLKYDWCYNGLDDSYYYAPDLDKITIQVGDNRLSYEAESPDNTISGRATKSASSTCSGGYKVGYIGNNDGEVQFNKINVPESGGYKMTIYYINGDEKRPLYVSVNGAEGMRYDLPGGGNDWNTVRTYEVTVDLKAGDNTIKFYCPLTSVDAAKQQYIRMRDALKKTGRPIVFSICEWGSNKPWLWGAEVGHLWRTTGDISDNWSSMVNILDRQVGLEVYAGPGHWNDPDMLEVGNGGMTDTEYRSHFSLWSILAAPLLAGNDIRNMSEATKEILLNKEVIAVDQDPLGKQGYKFRDDGDQEVWVRELANGDRAVVLFNRGETAAAISVNAEELGLSDAPVYVLRDLWKHTDFASSGTITATVEPHGVAMYRVHPSTPDQVNNVKPALNLTLSYEGFITPGENNKITVNLANNGIIPIKDVDIDIQLPNGWAISDAAPTGYPELPAGKSISLICNVIPPNDAPVGLADIKVIATYKYGDESIEGQEQSDIQVRVPPSPPSKDSYLSDLPWLGAASGWGPVEKDMSIGGNKQGDGKAITINGVTFTKGLGTHAPSTIEYYLGGKCTKFSAQVGIDDEVGNRGSVVFQVWADGQKIWDSGLMTGDMAARTVDVDITGVNVLKLVVTDGGDDKNYDHADWADARVTCAPLVTITGPDTVTSGSEFTETIKLKSVTDTVYASVYAADITVEYDEDLFELTTCEEAGGDIIIAAVYEEEPGRVRILLASTRGMEGDDVALFNITFKAKDVGDTATGTVKITKAELGTAPEGGVIEAATSGKTIQVTPQPPIVDRTQLAAKIEYAENLNEEDYTPESWAKLQEALGKAKTVYNDPDATQEQVDKALSDLQQAIDSLEQKQPEKPFTLITDGKLDRATGIKAAVKVKPVEGIATHEGKEAVLFQLMKDTTPVSIIAVEKDILTEEEVIAHFNVIDPENSAYRVKAFVFDQFNSDITAPKSLAEPVELQ
ncbi:NPCBM/NEW2 domain-containing protein [Thermoanaerobacterium sp. DL9XJH110]|uniref:NPCBM/NEW2 domain-containing protein n=1 Tax=Thermoanaerobacterium sp. DL9XJH110 TaxID=3386643 RepID=UPI003BB5C501